MDTSLDWKILDGCSSFRISPYLASHHILSRFFTTWQLVSTREHRKSTNSNVPPFIKPLLGNPLAKANQLPKPKHNMGRHYQRIWILESYFIAGHHVIVFGIHSLTPNNLYLCNMQTVLNTQHPLISHSIVASDIIMKSRIPSKSGTEADDFFGVEFLKHNFLDIVL